MSFNPSELRIATSPDKYQPIQINQQHSQAFGHFFHSKDLAVDSFRGNVSLPDLKQPGYQVKNIGLIHVKYQDKTTLPEASKEVQELYGQKDFLWEEILSIGNSISENIPNSLLIMEVGITLIVGEETRHFLATVISNQLEGLLYKVTVTEHFLSNTALKAHSTPNVLGVLVQSLPESGNGTTIHVKEPISLNESLPENITTTRELVDTKELIERVVKLAVSEGSFLYRKLTHKAILISLLASLYQQPQETVFTQKIYASGLQQNVTLEEPIVREKAEGTQTTQHFSAYFSADTHITTILAKRVSVKNLKDENSLGKTETNVTITTRHTSSEITFTLKLQLGLNNEMEDEVALFITPPKKSPLPKHEIYLEPENGLTSFTGGENIIVSGDLTEYMHRHKLTTNGVIVDMMHMLDLTLAEIRASEQSK
jgi:hypothetical protein